MLVQRPPIRVEQRDHYRRRQQHEVIPHPRSPKARIVPPQELAEAACEIQSDQNPPIDESSVQICPDEKQGCAAKDRFAGVPLEQAQKEDDSDEGEEMRS